jgi:cell surface protein SprA
LEGRSNFGYWFMLFVALLAAILTATARVPRKFFFPIPVDDSTKFDTVVVDTARQLKFPLHDKTGDPYTDYRRPKSIDLKDPKNESRSFDYDADSNRYYYNDRVGDKDVRNPSYLTLGEYTKYRGRMDEDAYWQRRLDAMMQFNKKPELPQMYKEGLFDRIFGSTKFSVKPQGNVDVTFARTSQNIKNPTLVQRAQRFSIFDFDMQMNINLLATIGDKMKLNISNNTKAAFDYQNVQRLDYSGKDDEMLKKIEAGNVSFPLRSNLINGVQSLFGLKAQLQFGKLWVTGVVSQQKSQRKSLTLQGGAQTQQFSIKADAYEENKNFLLSHYFRNNYNKALADFPVINSQVIINKIQVWITNRNGAVTNVRETICFQDLGEKDPFQKEMANGSPTVRDGLPDNAANRLYTLLSTNPDARRQGTATNPLVRDYNMRSGQDFEHTTARQLAASEYYFNPQLGYIMLRTQMNPDDVLGIAYRYTYKGKAYQVGEFAEDLPPDTLSPKVLFVKLLKGTSNRPTMPVWDLMMKNVYVLGGFGITKENFTLNVFYQDPAGGEKRYMPEGPKQGTPFISLLNLDRLNAQNQAQPDGVFDFIEGLTINLQQGKVIFPVLEPFGKDLADAQGPDFSRVLNRRYIYQPLYDSTKTIAQQYQALNRFLIKGTYKSSGSSEIYLGGFNIPQGSVSVTAGGTRLVENQDYTIEYGLGRIKIINAGILASGVPINIQYEDNSNFGFQQQNFMGARFDYYANKNLTLGGTLMRLTERPFTQKVNFGEDPIKNTVIGLDGNYQNEVPAVTRLLDKLPIYSTTAPSYLNATGEVAGILPGHPAQIRALDPEGAVYIDDFEGTTSSYDLRFPSIAWSLASAPQDARGQRGQTLFPEAERSNDLSYGFNRARLAWYTIEPTLVDPGGSTPDYVKNDSNQHYIRMVQIKDVFPNRPAIGIQSQLATFDVGYYPKDRGPYNFDAVRIDDSGHLTNPAGRWGGIQRAVDNTDFEASNVQFIQFWMMDPFAHNKNPNTQGGSFFINLGNVSEDVMKDSRLSFENGVPNPFDRAKLDTTAWGFVPRFQQQITRAFDNDPTARTAQDVGYDEMNNAQENTHFRTYLANLGRRLGTTNPAYLAIQNDPANDDYKYFRGSDFDQAQIGVLGRYKRFNNPEGNSPVTDPNAAFATSATTIPESEDINRDNTLTEAENYFQYRLDLAPARMVVGTNHIINKQVSQVRLPNGRTEDETWYQFKIPILNYDHRVGGIADFRSIRFIRMFLTGWEDSTFLRFASLELGRSQWRTYNYSLNTPGENIPQQNTGITDFAVTAVSIEENASRTPVPYVIPPGVQRQLTQGANQTQTIQLNEQSISLRACALQDGDARAVFKEVNVDMRQFNFLRMFIHAESQVDQVPIKNGDLNAFIRIGSDFSSNYYEYRVPLTITSPTNISEISIWPAANQVNLVLQDLVDAKRRRDEEGWPTFVPYETTDSKGNKIIILGTPNIGTAKNMMLGMLNPKKTNNSPNDDGLAKCGEIWFDEMRLAGTKDYPGYAAAGKVSLQMADLGNVNLSGSMHTQGYGNIDQKIQQRSQDNFYQYNASTNLNLGKLVPRKWGLQLPFYGGYTQTVSTPKYNPYDLDVLLRDATNASRNAARADSIRKAAQDFTSITSFNFTNVRITGAAGAARLPLSVKNFDFSYSYYNQFKRNPFLALDNTNTQKFGVGYTYGIKSKPFEPFKKAINGKYKWLALVRDFNVNPLPSTVTFRSDMTRMVQEIKIRNLDDGLDLPATFYKNFTWLRSYTTRWELTKSLSFDYTANNTSRIDEPFGKINTPSKRDTLLGRVGTLGRNILYGQMFNSSYTVPFAKVPALDWVNVRLTYSANYTWTAAAPVAYRLGNTIGNTSTRTVNGNFNVTQLYNKWRWTRALSTKPVAKPTGNKPQVEEAKSQQSGPPKVSTVQPKGPKGPPGTRLPGMGGGFSGDIDDSGPSVPGAVSTPKGGAPGALPGAVSTPGGALTGAGGGNGNAGGTGGNPGGSGSTTPSGSSSTGVGGTTPSGGGTKGPDNAGGAGATGAGATGAGATGAGATGTGGAAGTGATGSGGGTKGTADPGGGKGSTSPLGGSGATGGTTGATGSGIEGVDNIFKNVNTAGMTDAQLDSLVDAQHRIDKARKKAEKLKKRKERRAKRKAKRATTPDLPLPVRVIGNVLTMVSQVTVNYTQTAGNTLPGYIDSTRFMGINNFNLAPGINYVYGYQPDRQWLQQRANDGKLTRDSLFNSQFLQTYSQNLTASAAMSPIKDLRIDLTLTKSFTKTHNELFKDTGTGVFNHLDPWDNGSFNISYISVRTMFQNTGVGSEVYNQFLDNREIVSRRLGASNPYTNGLPDPRNNAYTKGYTSFSQDVLIPSFIAAYSGKDAATQPLISHDNRSIRSNPFRYLLPMPNWRVSYTGLSKLPAVQKYLANFVLDHAYTGTMSMNSFNSSLLFQDMLGLGFPSFIDSNSQNYIPFFQVPNVTMSQSFNPLLGVNVGFKNNLTGRFEIKRSKSISLSLTDYQVSENVSTEYVIGIGFRKKGIKLPIKVFGVQKLKNELIGKLDIGLRDDKTSNAFLSNNIGVTSRGQRALRISPSIDYAVRNNLTVRLFYERQQTIPYVSTAFPITNTRAGVTLRFLFNQ